MGNWCKWQPWRLTMRWISAIQDSGWKVPVSTRVLAKQCGPKSNWQGGGAAWEYLSKILSHGRQHGILFVNASL